MQTIFPLSSFIKCSTSSHQNQQKSTSSSSSSSSSLLNNHEYKLSMVQMGKKRTDLAQRAWNVVRLALLWARKGGVCRRRLMMELRLVPKYLKNLGHTSTPRGQIFYQERELSFDKTPIFHLKTHRSASMRFLLPCISPQVDFESYDFNAGDGGHEYEYDDNEYEKYGDNTKDEDEEVEGIDTRAEKFIAQFYEQMRMQRQISYLEYHETPSSTTASRL